MSRRFAAPALLLLAVLAGLAGCAATDSAPEDGAHEYTLVFLKTGPRSGQLTPDENRAAFAGHFSNMERLAEERRLLVAGPFGTTRHDAALRGLFVLATSSPDEARALGLTDPTTAAGVFTQEQHALRTDAPLLAALESDLARNAAARAEGRTPSPGEGARPYVLLTAEDGAAARRELQPLCSSGGGVLLLAELDGTRCLALLDATDAADAQQRYGATLALIGAHVLDDWYASDQLARLPEFASR